MDEYDGMSACKLQRCLLVMRLTVMLFTELPWTKMDS
jgi:hypothetical protein